MMTTIKMVMMMMMIMLTTTMMIMMVMMIMMIMMMIMMMVMVMARLTCRLVYLFLSISLTRPRLQGLYKLDELGNMSLRKTYNSNNVGAKNHNLVRCGQTT